MAWEEWQRVPFGLLEQVIEYRVYAATKALYDSATPEALKALPWSPMMTLVKTIDFDLANEARRG